MSKREPDLKKKTADCPNCSHRYSAEAAACPECNQFNPVRSLAPDAARRLDTGQDGSEPRGASRGGKEGKQARISTKPGERQRPPRRWQIPCEPFSKDGKTDGKGAK